MGHQHDHARGAIRMIDIVAIIVLLSSSYGCGLAYIMAGNKPDDAPPEASTGDGERNDVATMELHELPTDNLIILAELGKWGAVRERFIREVMKVDAIRYEAAVVITDRIAVEMTESLKQETSKMNLFIGICLLSGIGSLFGVYSYTFGNFINETFVLAEHAEPDEVDTVWEVGGWTWGWMEPLLGTAAFSILCAQLLRGI